MNKVRESISPSYSSYTSLFLATMMSASVIAYSPHVFEDTQKTLSEQVKINITSSLSSGIVTNIDMKLMFEQEFKIFAERVVAQQKPPNFEFDVIIAENLHTLYINGFDE